MDAGDGGGGSMGPLTLRETPAMQKDTARLFWCQNCGGLLYVPDGTTTKRDLTGSCPVCAKDMWTRLEKDQGPYKWGER